VSKVIDIIGNVYGELEVIGYSHTNKNYRSYWECKCSCGTVEVISKHNLTTGRSKSCGHNIKYNSIKHNMSYERIYNIYMHMKSRCYNENNEHFSHYKPYIFGNIKESLIKDNETRDIVKKINDIYTLRKLNWELNKNKLPKIIHSKKIYEKIYDSKKFEIPIQVNSVGSFYIMKYKVAKNVKYTGEKDSEQIEFMNNARSKGYKIFISQRLKVLHVNLEKYGLKWHSSDFHTIAIMRKYFGTNPQLKAVTLHKSDRACNYGLTNKTLYNNFGLKAEIVSIGRKYQF